MSRYTPADLPPPLTPAEVERLERKVVTDGDPGAAVDVLIALLEIGDHAGGDPLPWDRVPEVIGVEKGHGTFWLVLNILDELRAVDCGTSIAYYWITPRGVRILEALRTIRANIRLEDDGMRRR